MADALHIRHHFQCGGDNAQILCHRLLLNNEARLSGTTAGDVLAGILAQLPAPPYRGEELHEA